MNIKPKSFHPSDEAIAGMYAAGRLASRTLDKVDEMLKADPYRTTEEIDRMCHEFITEHGGFPECFGYKSSMSPIPYNYATCISVNDAACHGVPTSYRLKDGDVINVDLVVRYPAKDASDIDNSWLGDTSRSYGIGNITTENQYLLTIAKNAMYAGMKVVRNGMEFKDIGTAIEGYVRAFNESGVCSKKMSIIPHFCGHGISKTLHEDPYVRPTINNCSDIIRYGVFFTVEPIIVFGDVTETFDADDHWTALTQSGENAKQFEHTMGIDKNGKLMIFTTSDDAHEQSVLDEIAALTY